MLISLLKSNLQSLCVQDQYLLLTCKVLSFGGNISNDDDDDDDDDDEELFLWYGWPTKGV